MADTFNIVELFFHAATKYPGTTAIIFKKNKISFIELEKQVTATSNYFLQQGIKKGDHVLVLIPMSIDLYRIVLALFNIGATVVFFDEWVSIKRIQECCRIVPCQALVGVFKARVAAFFVPELDKIPIKIGREYVMGNPAIIYPPSITKKDDTALITFTTGSTGTPKAAKRTHQFLHYQFTALVEKIQPRQNDIDMPVLPIVLLINLATGTTSVIADFKISKPELIKPKKIIKQIWDHSINKITASPFFIKAISTYIIENKIPTDNIRNIFTGGAPVFPGEAEIYIKAFPHAKTEIIYGSTEAEPISSINAYELLKRKNDIHIMGLMVGKVDKSVEVKIIKIIDKGILISTEEELLNIEMPVKEIGEIIVKGNHVLREYVNDAEALSRNKIFVGNTCWHRTGDCGRVDENGMLYLTGRCNTLIKSNGKLFSPFIYENYFQMIDGVETGTILMLKGTIAAVIELNDTSKKRSVTNLIQAFVNEPKEIIFIKKIPRDPRHNSKIDYDKLRKELSGS